jgi:hypothetical protein
VADCCCGTLVVHALPDAECTDLDCTECQPADHTLVIRCTDVDGTCPVCAPQFAAA